MKKIGLTIIILSFLILSSCNNSRNLKYLSGYWEISSVKKDNNKIKNYPFSGTIDYFELNKNLTEGFRKKVKPRIDGNFDITMHQINFNIDEEKKRFRLFKFNLNFSNSIKLFVTLEPKNGTFGPNNISAITETPNSKTPTSKNLFK